MASAAEIVPPSAPERMPSTASSAPGILRSASIARTAGRAGPAPERSLQRLRIDTERSPLDLDGCRQQPLRRGLRSLAEPETPVGTDGQGAKHRPRVALEAVDGTFLRRGVPANVGRALQPARGLLVEIVVVHERAAVEEALANVANRALHLALGLCPIGPAGAGQEPPVRGEPEELCVQYQAAAGGAIVGQHHSAYVDAPCSASRNLNNS